MATNDYIKQLKKDKEKLSQILQSKNVEVNSNETFTTLVPKVEQISGGSSKYAPRYICFYGYNGTELDEEFENLDISRINNLESCFAFCTRLDHLPKNFKDLDFSNITSFGSMCQRTGQFSATMGDNKIDLSNMNTTSLVNCISVFNYFKAKELDISGWDVSNVDSLYQCFGDAEIETLKISGWKFGEQGDLSNAFASSKIGNFIGIDTWDVSKVSTFNETFAFNYDLKTLDLSGWHTDSATDIGRMFLRDYNLQYLDIRNFNFDLVENYADAFNGIPDECEIIVKGEAERQWILEKFETLSNIKTVAELGEGA